ncbi:MAG: hypothetical protein IJU19_02370 [Bacteroidales bacterium]|nr:hypothetical protein [Bacteroidales bacterium]
MAKKKAHKTKKYTLLLTECELRRLTAIADAYKVSRPVALARLTRQGLREAAAHLPKRENCAANQLGLFDIVQIDIFNNLKKVEKIDV